MYNGKEVSDEFTRIFKENKLRMITTNDKIRTTGCSMMDAVLADTYLMEEISPKQFEDEGGMSWSNSGDIIKALYKYGCTREEFCS